MSIDKPTNGKLAREDFRSIKECDDEILNIKWIIEDMVQENAERIAQNRIISVITDYKNHMNSAHGNPE